MAQVHNLITTLPVRLLIDSGSEVTFVSESIIKQLKLTRRASSLKITGIGGKTSASTLGSAQFKISSNHSNESITVCAHILKKITTLSPSCYIKNHNWPELRTLTLGDPRFYEPRSVDILIGADYYGSIIKQQLIRLRPENLIAQLTIFGWVIIGPTSTKAIHPSSYSVTVQQNEELKELLTRFWLQEEIANSSTLTPEEEECEAHFKTTHLRDSSGRYVVRIPLKEDRSALGCSQWIASKCLARMKRKLDQDSTLKEMYFSFMREYESLGHMRLVASEGSSAAVSRVLPYYLPHHGVLKPDSSTTKLRVVFNGSCVSSSGKSLNDIMHTGPNLLLNIMDVLIWVRIHKHVFATDITKMYRQVLIHPDDWDLQRILWLNDCSKEVSYQLTTVTYGTKAAPFLATRALLQLVNDEGGKFPLAVPSLTHGRYVDDIFGGAESSEQLIEIAHQLIDLCKAGGFPLAKWHSTDTNLLRKLTQGDDNSQDFSLDDCDTKLLGLSWNPKGDFFKFCSKVKPAPNKLTKRLVLSEVAQIFDPLGLISPVIIKAKILLQELWALQLGWDEKLPPSVSSAWLNFREQLTSLASVSIPRWSGALSNSKVELHGFADASQLAMAACVYLVTHSSSTGHSSILLCSKTKVAPLKKLTIPRLELTAALMLAQLINHLKGTLKLHISATHLWTDSKVTLHWINTHPSRWKDYVRNRVAQIQELTNNITWRHVPGTVNPADCASRGVTPEQLKKHTLWWTGPQWITQSSAHWPPQLIAECTEAESEARPKTSLVAVKTEPAHQFDLIYKFSSLYKLLRVTALCLQLKRRLLRQLDHPPANITAEDLRLAQLFWVKQTQQLYFKEELRTLSRGRLLPPNHVMTRLTAFLDEDGVIRVGGRLNELDISYEEKHPAILPRHSPWTALVIDEAHRVTLHSGT